MVGPSFWRGAAVAWSLLLSAALISPGAAGMTELAFLPAGWGDKLLHFAGFSVLGLLLTLSVDFSGERPEWLRQLAVAGGVGLGLAVGLEVAQLVIPARDFDLLDLAVNVFSVGLFTLGVFWLRD